MNSVIFRLLSLCSAIACALGLPGGASAQKLTRPEIKSISAPAYYPGGGIGFTATIADQLAYLNVEMMRVEFIADNNEQKTINYPAYDYIVDQAAAHGVKILGLVDYTSIRYENQAEWETDDFRARFVARLSEIVEHYHDRPNPIRHWEIWNEEDIQLPEFNVRIDPEPYARLLIDCYAAVKSIDPEAVVVLGGISPKGLYYGENYLDDLYNTEEMQDYYTENGYYPFDVVGVHPYPEIYSNPVPALGNVLQIYIKSVMNNYGDRHKKVWLTEMGWSSYFVSESLQAQYLRDSYLLVDTLKDSEFPDDPPYVEQYFWFQYRDFGAVDRWGLFTENMARKKPSYTAYLNLTDPGPEPPPPPGSTTDSPVWNATSDSALPVKVSAVDILNGLAGQIIAGGFHEANQGTVAALTDGVFNSNGTTLVLQDYASPALRVRYTLSEPMDLTEVRTFAGHAGDGGDRSFQAVDIYINGQLAAEGLTTGPYGQLSEGTSGVSVLRWRPEGQNKFVATNVETIDVAFYCVTAIEGGFRDRWSPINHPDLDLDGADAAFVAPIIKEIDVFGEPHAVVHGWMFLE